MEERLTDHPRTQQEVARYYGVTTRTLKNWLRRAGLHALARRKGTGSNYYTILELERIVRALGE